MCFEVPALVPPGGLVNGNKTGYNDDDANVDDLGIMDIDDNDSKTGTFPQSAVAPVYVCPMYAEDLLLSVFKLWLQINYLIL